MADRTVRVRVIAEMPGYTAAMRGGAADTALLGDAAVAAGAGVVELGVGADEARGGLAALATGARGGAAAMAEAEGAAVTAGRGIRAAGAEAEAGATGFARIGTVAKEGMTEAEAAVGGVMESLTHLGTLLAGGAIIFGLHDIVELGNEYNDSMQKFQEVTRATGAQMNLAATQAQALGADLKLPSASASEAADAMVDLAKSGLSAQDAITAARGTIQLAAAARTDIATAAQIEGDVMDQFSLKAQDASHVADVLANTANSASGQLMDIYYAMKYVGPIAHTMGISVQDAATAVGLLGKSGIIGETAGTALRSALVNMAKPTAQVTEGLKALGIQAFDSSGQFKGLQYLVTQLGTAQEHMSTQSFVAAAAMAFGKPALAAMVALAHQGGPAFQQFGEQVGRVGGAASLAAAESKGLGGAMRSLGKEISSAFLQIYLAIAPGLESVTRGMTNAVAGAIPGIKAGIKMAIDVWDIYGPGVEAKLGSAFGVVEADAGHMADVVGAKLGGLAVEALPLVVKGVEDVGTGLSTLESDSRPVVAGLDDLYKSATSSGGALSTLGGRLEVSGGLIASTLGSLHGATSVLGPLGQVIGALVHDFAALPGPIQLSVISMLAMRPFRPQIQAMQASVVGFGRSGVEAFRGIGDASLYQRVLAAGAGQELGRFGGYIAAIEARSPGIAAMGSAFRGVYDTLPATATGLERVGTGLRGIGSAAAVGAMSGLRSATSGLINVMGGPWGIAMAAAMTGLDLLAKKQQEAAAAAAAHQARISSLAQALEESGGAINANVRTTTVETLADAKLADGKTMLMDVMGKANVSALELTDAYLGQGETVDQLRTKLSALATANSFASPTDATVRLYDAQGQAYKDAADALNGYSGDVPQAVAKAKELAAAVSGSGDAAGQATDPVGRLKSLIKTLGDTSADTDTKARALHDALTLLSGGALDVQAAVATQNQALLQLNQAYSDGVDQSKGYGAALLQVDGSLNTTSENGQTLWNNLQAVNTATAAAASATYDYARANGDDVPTALKKAEDAMQGSWEAAVTAGQKYGLTANQAANLAAQMGNIPSSVSILLNTPGLDDTTKDLLYVQGLAGHLPAGATIKVSALTDDAVKDLTSVGVIVHALPGGRQMEITAPTDKAQSALDALIAKTIPAKTVDVEADTKAALTGLQIVKQTLAGVPGVHSITVQALSQEALDALHAIGYTTETLPNGRVTVTIPTTGPLASTQAIQSYIDRLEGTTVNVKVHTDYTTTGVGPYAGKALPNANGGYYARAFAAGGITAFAGGTERHVAQIAPAGAMRLWAEPETGGEAYIPLSPAKRGRSTAILGQVAQGFGLQLIPAHSVATQATSATYDQSRTQHLHLHGAKQSSAEQVADVMRHMAVVG